MTGEGGCWRGARSTSIARCAKLPTPPYPYAARVRSTYYLSLQTLEFADPTFVSGFGPTAFPEEL